MARRGRYQAAMEGLEGFEISATVFDTRSGLSLQRQIGLRDDPDDALFRVHHGNSSHLVLLHKSFAGLDILAIPTGERSQGNDFFDWRGFRIHALGDDGTAQIAVGDHSDQFSGLLIIHNRHGTDVSIAQDFGDRLCRVGEHTTSGIAAHNFSDLHRITSESAASQS